MLMQNPNPVDPQRIKEFLESAPLYKAIEVSLPENYRQFLPEVLNLFCSYCDGKQPYRDLRSGPVHEDVIKEIHEAVSVLGLGDVTGVTPIMPTGVYAIIFQCQGCKRASYYCWLNIAFKNATVGTAAVVEKIGQLPPYGVELPSRIRNRISQDAALFYRRAQTCIEHSYGIGACVYLRRMLEDQINSLLQVNFVTKKRESAPDKELKRFEDAIKAQNFDEKIRLISQDLPDSVNVPGNNPVLLMFRKLSDGLHNKSEGESVDIAQQVSIILIGLLVDLQEEREKRERLTKAVRSLTKAQ